MKALIVALRVLGVLVLLLTVITAFGWVLQGWWAAVAGAVVFAIVVAAATSWRWLWARNVSALD